MANITFGAASPKPEPELAPLARQLQEEYAKTGNVLVADFVNESEANAFLYNFRKAARHVGFTAREEARIVDEKTGTVKLELSPQKLIVYKDSAKTAEN